MKQIKIDSMRTNLSKLIKNGILVASLFLLEIMASCGGKIDPNRPRNSNSYKDFRLLTKAIDSLHTLPAWDGVLFNDLLLSIYTDKQYKLITSGETHTCYAQIFRGSGKYVREHLENLMKSPDYRDLGKWESVAKSVRDSLHKYTKIDPTLENPDPDLTVVFDMIKEYRNVERLSNSRFGQSVNCIERYSMDYHKVEKTIKDNKYWGNYFCHNAKINNNISDFPDRVKASRADYYRNLEEEIKSKAIEEKVSKTVLEDALQKFNNFSDNNNNTLKEDLAGFVLDYVEPESPSDSNLSQFWK